MTPRPRVRLRTALLSLRWRAALWRGARAFAPPLLILASSLTPAGATAPPVLPARASAAAPVTISYPNPYSACRQNRSELGATAEPTLAVAPAARRSAAAVVAAWIQGNGVGIAAARRGGAGQRWSVAAVPFTRCAVRSSPYDQAGDEWASAGPDGTVYLSALVRRQVGVPRPGKQPAYTWDLAVVTSRGGQSWSPVRVVYRGSTSTVHADKPTIAADPVRPGRAYLVWTAGHFEPWHETTSGLFSVTYDFGRTWSRPQAIIRSTPSTPVSELHTILVDRRTGTLTDIFHVLLPKSKGLVPDHLGYSESHDHGKTWSRLAIAADFAFLDQAAEGYSAAVRGGFSLSATADPASGRQYIVWEDGRCHALKSGGIALISRARGSRSWTRFACLRERQPAFLPTVAVNSAGVVAVSFYRILAVKAYNDFVTDFEVGLSYDQGRHFPDCRRVAPSFNIAKAPRIRAAGAFNGYFIGDYEAMVAVGRSFDAVFVGPTKRGWRGLGMLSVAVTPARAQPVLLDKSSSSPRSYPSECERVQPLASYLDVPLP